MSLNMDNQTNKCARCGKQRIVINSHQETVGTGVITYTETACPDPECQKALDKQLLQERQKREQTILLGHKKYS